jgi:hypothetical protein
MIILDGHTYRVHQTNYSNKQTKVAAIERGLGGTPLRMESGAFQDDYDLVLVCTLAQIDTLQDSFAKVLISNNAVDFMDEEGVHWIAGAGVNDATHRYGTGVYFAPSRGPKPITATGWTEANRFLVSVHLLTAAYWGLGFETGYLLSEIGENLTTEANERLLWEINS